MLHTTLFKWQPYSEEILDYLMLVKDGEGPNSGKDQGLKDLCARGRSVDEAHARVFQCVLK